MTNPDVSSGYCLLVNKNIKTTLHFKKLIIKALKSEGSETNCSASEEWAQSKSNPIRHALAQSQQ